MLYTPEHFALTAGAELSGSKAGEVPSIPKVFGYYAETAAYHDIITVPAPPPPAPPHGVGFFGAQTNDLTALTPKLPTAVRQFSPGSLIMIYGEHYLTANNQKYILYLVVTSTAGEESAYAQIYLNNSL